MIQPLWQYIHENYNSNRAFARDNNLSTSTVQNAIGRDRHYVNLETKEVLIKNNWRIK